MDDLIEQLRKIERASDIPPKGHPGLAKRAADEIERLRGIIKEAIDAFDAGNLQMASPEIGEPENDIPMHQWHEQWLHYARGAQSEGQS